MLRERAGLPGTKKGCDQLDYRDGRIVNANMSDYLVPANADVPALNATFLPAEDEIADPIGVKGLGELVIVAVPAAIAN